ncbi:phage holin family protein [Halomonas shantousis]
MEPDNRNTKTESSFGSLISSLTHDMTTLVRQEIDLARAEMSQNMKKAVAAIGAIAAAGVVLMGGFLVLLFAAVYALSNVLAPWLSALIVAIVVMVIGFIMLQSGRKKLQAQSLMPSRTLSSVRRDEKVVEQHGKGTREQMK